MAGRAHDHLGRVDPLHLKRKARKGEGVSGGQGGGKAFFQRAELASPLEAHLDQRRIDDNARVHAVLLYEAGRSEEHTSELQSLMRISYAVFCLKKKKITHKKENDHKHKK